MIKKVLVCVDGSEYSDKALNFALDFGEKFEAAVTILNVAESLVMSAAPPEAGVYPSGSTAIVAKDLRAIQEEILNKAIAHAKAVKPNLAVLTESKEGDAAFEIVNTAKEEGFDVIIVGHRGISKMRERFLGVVSEKVAHSATCTVILVK